MRHEVAGIPTCRASAVLWSARFSFAQTYATPVDFALCDPAVVHDQDAFEAACLFALQFDLDRDRSVRALRCEVGAVPRGAELDVRVPGDLPFELRISEHFAWAFPVPGPACGQPGGRPRAGAVVRPPRRLGRARRRGHGQPGHPHATAGGDQQRAVTADHRIALDPSLALEPARMRASHPLSPAHRAPPRVDRTWSHPRQPLKAGKRCRSRPQLTSHQPPLRPPPSPIRSQDCCPRPVPVPASPRLFARSSAAEPRLPERNNVEGG